MAWRTKLLNFGGKLGHTMVDDRFAANPPVDQLPHLAWFGVYCAKAPGGGLWDLSEGSQLDAIEGDLLFVGVGLAWLVQPKKPKA